MPAAPEVRLHLTVTSGASANGIDRDPGGRLRVRVSAPARDGKANRELLSYLAGVVGAPKSSLLLISGQASRYKVVLVRGLSAVQVKSRLDVEIAR